jgi:hypothetical protein
MKSSSSFVAILHDPTLLRAKMIDHTGHSIGHSTGAFAESIIVLG